jgi:SAM-dependent methyltransferase
VSEWFAAMREEGGLPAGAEADVKEGDALNLPFPDGDFDRVVASEVLEHIPDDDGAIAELVRVLRPGGTIAVTVPRWLPEKVCWALSDAYHEVEGGHVRIYRGSELVAKLERAGLRFTGRDHVHGLHSPYWWLKCAVGVTKDQHPAVRAYHRVLVWDIVKRPLATRLAERVMDPLLGKSMVLYLEKPGAA